MAFFPLLIKSCAGDQGALTQLVNFLERPLDEEAELVDVIMRRDALVLLAALCEANAQNKVYFYESNARVHMPDMHS